MDSLGKAQYKLENYKSYSPLNFSFWGNNGRSIFELSFDYSDVDRFIVACKYESEVILDVICVTTPINRKQFKDLKKFIETLKERPLIVLVSRQIEDFVGVSFEDLSKDISFDLVINANNIELSHILERIFKKRYESVN